MARVRPRERELKRAFCLKFQSVVRGHHVYKTIWTPVIGERLICKHDTREKAKLFDDYAVGIYKDEADGEEKHLVGHVPIELSFLMCKFLVRKGNDLEFSPTGSRYLEDGLVVPGLYTAFSVSKQMISILHNELHKKKEKLKHMTIILSEISTQSK